MSMKKIIDKSIELKEELVAIQKYALAALARDIQREAEESLNQDLTIQGIGTIGNTAWSIKILDGDTIPQRILEIRDNGEIYYRETLIHTDKELVNGLYEIAHGTMESRVRVTQLELENQELHKKLRENDKGRV